MGYAFDIFQPSAFGINLPEPSTLAVSVPVGKDGKDGAGTGLVFVIATGDLTLSPDTAVSIQKTDGSKLIATLPVSCAAGKLFEIDGHSAGGWQVNQNAGQQFINSGLTTTAGVGHGFKSGSASDTIIFRCIIADILFQIISISGLAQAY